MHTDPVTPNPAQGRGNAHGDHGRGQIMNSFRSLVLGLPLLWSTGVAWAQDLSDPVGTADAFSAALASGDEAAVKTLLATDVLIYESGGQESSREEYVAHHMRSDMAFLRKVQVRMIDRRHGASDDLAWVATRTRTTGTYKDKPVDLHGTESLVLRREPAGWRIIHVQWSSRPAEPGAQ